MSGWLYGLAAGLQGYMGARDENWRRRREEQRYEDELERIRNAEQLRQDQFEFVKKSARRERKDTRQVRADTERNRELERAESMIGQAIQLAGSGNFPQAQALKAEADGLRAKHGQAPYADDILTASPAAVLGSAANITPFIQDPEVGRSILAGMYGPMAFQGAFPTTGGGVDLPQRPPQPPPNLATPEQMQSGQFPVLPPSAYLGGQAPPQQPPMSNFMGPQAPQQIGPVAPPPDQIPPQTSVMPLPGVGSLTGPDLDMLRGGFHLQSSQPPAKSAWDDWFAWQQELRQQAEQREQAAAMLEAMQKGAVIDKTMAETGRIHAETEDIPVRRSLAERELNIRERDVLSQIDWRRIQAANEQQKLGIAQAEVNIAQQRLSMDAGKMQQQGATDHQAAAQHYFGKAQEERGMLDPDPDMIAVYNALGNWHLEQGGVPRTSSTRAPVPPPSPGPDGVIRIRGGESSPINYQGPAARAQTAPGMNDAEARAWLYARLGSRIEPAFHNEVRRLGYTNQEAVEYYKSLGVQ